MSKAFRSPIILASASPRRTELLQLANIPHVVHPADIDESLIDGESAYDYVKRMAIEKAQAVAAKLTHQYVLAADTTVVINGKILGKPYDALQAVRFLRLLSGKTHQVMTAICVVNPAAGSRLHSLVHTSEVTFSPLTDLQISRYVATAEPLDKAGAYAIQGRGSALVQHLSGSYSSVMGLPLAETQALLQKCGWGPGAAANH